MKQNYKKRFAPVIVLAIISILTVTQFAHADTAPALYSISPESATVKPGESFTFYAYSETNSGKVPAPTTWGINVLENAKLIIGQDCKTIDSTACTVYANVTSKDNSVFLISGKATYQIGYDTSYLKINKRGL